MRRIVIPCSLVNMEAAAKAIEMARYTRLLKWNWWWGIVPGTWGLWLEFWSRRPLQRLLLLALAQLPVQLLTRLLICWGYRHLWAEDSLWSSWELRFTCRSRYFTWFTYARKEVSAKAVAPTSARPTTPATASVCMGCEAKSNEDTKTAKLCFPKQLVRGLLLWLGWWGLGVHLAADMVTLERNTIRATFTNSHVVMVWRITLVRW